MTEWLNDLTDLVFKENLSQFHGGRVSQCPVSQRNSLWGGLLLLFWNPHPRICFYLFQKGEGRETERERETSMWERNIDQLPPGGTPTRDQTLNPGMCPDQGSDLQSLGVWEDAPTNWEPPSQGEVVFLESTKQNLLICMANTFLYLPKVPRMLFISEKAHCVFRPYCSSSRHWCLY